jgi:hypothetical protein
MHFNLGTTRLPHEMSKIFFASEAHPKSLTCQYRVEVPFWPRDDRRHEFQVVAHPGGAGEARSATVRLGGKPRLVASAEDEDREQKPPVGKPR